MMRRGRGVAVRRRTGTRTRGDGGKQEVRSGGEPRCERVELN